MSAEGQHHYQKPPYVMDEEEKERLAKNKRKRQDLELLSLKRPTMIDDIRARTSTPKNPMPTNALPQWRDRRLDQKFPLIPAPDGTFFISQGELGERIFIDKPKSKKTFDTRDPLIQETPMEYDSLHDPNLKDYFQRNPLVCRRLVQLGLVNNEGQVLCSLAEFNKYRQYLGRMHNSDVLKELEKMETWEKSEFERVKELKRYIDREIRARREAESKMRREKNLADIKARNKAMKLRELEHCSNYIFEKRTIEAKLRKVKRDTLRKNVTDRLKRIRDAEKRRTRHLILEWICKDEFRDKLRNVIKLEKEVNRQEDLADFVDSKRGFQEKKGRYHRALLRRERMEKECKVSHRYEGYLKQRLESDRRTILMRERTQQHEVRVRYLMEKYGRKWLALTRKYSGSPMHSSVWHIRNILHALVQYVKMESGARSFTGFLRDILEGKKHGKIDPETLEAVNVILDDLMNRSYKEFIRRATSCLVDYVVDEARKQVLRHVCEEGFDPKDLETPIYSPRKRERIVLPKPQYPCTGPCAQFGKGPNWPCDCAQELEWLHGQLCIKLLKKLTKQMKAVNCQVDTLEDRMRAAKCNPRMNTAISRVCDLAIRRAGKCDPKCEKKDKKKVSRAADDVCRSLLGPGAPTEGVGPDGQLEETEKGRPQSGNETSDSERDFTKVAPIPSSVGPPRHISEAHLKKQGTQSETTTEASTRTSPRGGPKTERWIIPGKDAPGQTEDVGPEPGLPSKGSQKEGQPTTDEQQQVGVGPESAVTDGTQKDPDQAVGQDESVENGPIDEDVEPPVTITGDDKGAQTDQKTSMDSSTDQPPLVTDDKGTEDEKKPSDSTLTDEPVPTEDSQVGPEGQTIDEDTGTEAPELKEAETEPESGIDEPTSTETPPKQSIEAGPDEPTTEETGTEVEPPKTSDSTTEPAAPPDQTSTAEGPDDDGTKDEPSQAVPPDTIDQQSGDEPKKSTTTSVTPSQTKITTPQGTDAEKPPPAEEKGTQDEPKPSAETETEGPPPTDEQKSGGPESQDDGTSPEEGPVQEVDQATGPEPSRRTSSGSGPGPEEPPKADSETTPEEPTEVGTDVGPEVEEPEKETKGSETDPNEPPKSQPSGPDDRPTDATGQTTPTSKKSEAEGLGPDQVITDEGQTDDSAQSQGTEPDKTPVEDSSTDPDKTPGKVESTVPDKKDETESFTEPEKTPTAETSTEPEETPGKDESSEPDKVPSSDGTTEPDKQPDEGTGPDGQVQEPPGPCGDEEPCEAWDNTNIPENDLTRVVSENVDSLLTNLTCKLVQECVEAGGKIDRGEGFGPESGPRGGQECDSGPDPEGFCFDEFYTEDDLDLQVDDLTRKQLLQLKGKDKPSCLKQIGNLLQQKCEALSGEDREICIEEAMRKLREQCNKLSGAERDKCLENLPKEKLGEGGKIGDRKCSDEEISKTASDLVLSIINEQRTKLNRELAIVGSGDEQEISKIISSENVSRISSAMVRQALCLQICSPEVLEQARMDPLPLPDTASPAVQGSVRGKLDHIRSILDEVKSDLAQVGIRPGCYPTLLQEQQGYQPSTAVPGPSGTQRQKQPPTSDTSGDET